MKQTQRILQYMQEYGGITPAEAYTMLGCMRLAARISDLRHMGVKIQSKNASSVNQYGEVVHFARYTLL